MLWDRKLISTIAIIAVVMSSMAAVIVYDSGLKDSSSSGSTYNIIARVNSEGSGIYIKEGSVEGYSAGNDRIPDRNGVDYYKIDPRDRNHFIVDEDNAKAWGGLILGTPGATTIQHVQLKRLVNGMGMDFTRYQEGEGTSPNTVYFVQGMTNKVAVLGDRFIQGGILWEPQYSAIVNDKDGGFTELGLTNNFFPGHTCCIIAGYTPYMDRHPEVTERFLAGYIRGVDWVTDPANHDALIRLCVEKTSGISESVIKDAVDNIRYLYNDPSGDLNDLRKDIANLVDSLTDLQHSMNDLGFNSSLQFANALVDDSYLVEAERIHNDSGYEYAGRTATVTVAAISGDIHQIALHAAMAQGFFEDYGIKVNLSSAVNGPGVATALQNGNAQFGLMGAPPCTITAINGELVTK